MQASITGILKALKRLTVKRVIYLFVGKQSNLAVHTAGFQPLRNQSKFCIFVDGSHIINIYNPSLTCFITSILAED